MKPFHSLLCSSKTYGPPNFLPQISNSTFAIHIDCTTHSCPRNTSNDRIRIMCLYSIDRGESSFTPMVRGEKFVCGTSYIENRTEYNLRKSIPLIDDEDALFQNKLMPKIIKSMTELTYSQVRWRSVNYTEIRSVERYRL